MTTIATLILLASVAQDKDLTSGMFSETEQKERVGVLFSTQQQTSDLISPPPARPFKKHDLIQVIVVERSRGTSRAELRTDKRTRWEAEFNDFVRFDTSAKGNRRLRAAELADDPRIDIDARFRQDDLGRTTREFELQFTVQAEVVDVRPNGNLVIQAQRRRTVNEETEVIKLTGEVAPKDVTPLGVRSDKIANLDIQYEGDGSVSAATKRGLLARILDFLWPF